MASWGGPREGAGRKRKTTNKAEKQQRLRISEGLYHRWTELRNLRRAKNDEEVFSYVLDLAREVDQGSVTSSSVRPVISTPVRTTHSRVSRQGNDQQLSPNISGIAPSPISTAMPQTTEKSLLSRSILSESLPTIQGNPFSSDSEDDTYYPDADESDSDITSDEDDSLGLNCALLHLNSSGSESQSDDDDFEYEEPGVSGSESESADSEYEILLQLLQLQQLKQI